MIQAGAELCQTQFKLEVVVEVGVDLGIKVEACHFFFRWVSGG